MQWIGRCLIGDVRDGITGHAQHVAKPHLPYADYDSNCKTDGNHVVRWLLDRTHHSVHLLLAPVEV
jgi:hypothetical protein